MEHFLSTNRGMTIVETGCIREMDAWEEAGMSTLVFSDVVARIDHKLCSIDNNPEAVTLARIHSLGTVCEMDSIAALNAISTIGATKIDLLYLDSLDFFLSDTHTPALHALMELTAAAPSLRPGSLVFVDDNFIQPDASFIGKGMYINEFMRRSGRERVFTGYQLGWRW
jgi:predicted O-methyltransferase YrrM